MTAAFLNLARRLWPYALAGAAILALWLVIDAAGDARTAREAVRAKGAAEIAKGQEKASSAAAGAVADQFERDMARAGQEQERRDEILSAPNAGDPAGDAGQRGLGGLCGSPLYRDSPDCIRLRGKGSAPTPR